MNPTAPLRRLALSFAARLEDWATKGFTVSSLLPPSQLGRPMQSRDWTEERALREGFKASHIVYTCVKLIADAASSVPWHVEDADGQVVDGHPLAALLSRPNPYMDGGQLIERMTDHLYLAGNAVNKKVMVGTRTLELWPVNPDLVSPVPDAVNFISSYRIRAQGHPDEFWKQTEVLHVQFADPANPLWGMAPMQAVAKIVNTETDTVDWWRNSIQNRAVPDGILAFKTSLTKKQYDAVQQSVKDNKLGPDFARAPLIIGSDATWTPTERTPAEMDFLETRRFTRVDICMALRVPPPMIGIYDDATLANIETARRIFWVDCVTPYLSDLRNAFNLSFAAELAEGEKVTYDLSNIEALQEDLAEKVSTAQKLWAVGVPMEEVNRRLDLGLESFDGWDVGWIPSSLLPAADAGGAPPGPPSPPQAPAKGKVGFRGIFLRKAASAPARAAHWRAVDRSRRALERATYRRALKVLDAQAERAAFEHLHGRDAVAAMAEFGPAIGKVLTDSWRDAINFFGGATAHALGGRLKSFDDFELAAASWEFDPWDSEVQAAVQAFVGQKIVQIQSTTVQAVKDVIARALSDGLSTTETASALRSAAGFGRDRSFVIARTETASAANYGSHQAAVKSRAVGTKVWTTAGDDRVRPQPSLHGPADHVKMDGESRPIDELFSNGLMWPGDPRGPAAETVQCRCVIAYSR